jgi:hypothetical protein
VNRGDGTHQAAAAEDLIAGIVAKMSPADEIALACADFDAVAHLLPPVGYSP